MTTFERYLTLWVAVCIVAGIIALGQLFPGVFQAVGHSEIAQVDLPVAMLMKIDFGALAEVRRHWRGIGVTLFVNWAVKPFSMALLAAAPCTAMVFVWSDLADGESHFTLSQVALNDLIMVIAFAPIVGLLLGLSAITVPWATLVLSVGLYTSWCRS